MQIDVLEDRTVPSAAGAISGHVFTDLTGNGLSLDDSAKSAVTVRLYADSNHNGKLDGRDSLVASKVSGTDGSYLFGELNAGKYFVKEVTPGGFVRTDPAFDSHYTVNLKKGQSAGGFDFDNFEKVNTSAITNVTYTITNSRLGTYTVNNLRGNTHEGDIVTVNFTVAAGATATVSLVSYDAPGSRFDADKAGKQVIADQQSGTFGAGQHSLTVHLPSNFYQVDFVAGAAIDHFGPEGSNIFYSAQGRLLSADNGGTQKQKLGSLSGFVVSDNNADHIIDTGDTKLAGVTIVLSGTDDLGHAVSRTAITDEFGFYRFIDLRQGVYSLQQIPPAGLAAETALVGSRGGTLSNPDLISNIVLGNGKKGNNYNFLDVAQVQEQTYSISGAVVAPPGIPDASVEITDNSTGETIVAPVLVDADGNYSYSVSGLAAGHSFTIMAVVPGFTSSLISTDPLNSDLTDQDLVIGSGS